MNRTAAGGGSARSIHLLSKEQFGKEYRNLTKGQKDEVDAVQRAGWTWRNDHLNHRVHATGCDGFMASRSLATSICPKCKSLLYHKVFSVAIHKKIPRDENMKYVNTQFINEVLLGIYAGARGLRNIIEQLVSDTHYHNLCFTYDGL